jgi:hypothetical protein
MSPPFPLEVGVREQDYTRDVASDFEVVRPGSRCGHITRLLKLMINYDIIMNIEILT